MSWMIAWQQLKACRRWRVRRRQIHLLPAVDPIHAGHVGHAGCTIRHPVTLHVVDHHAHVAAAARGTLLRYTDLHVQYENRGLDGLFYLHHLEKDRVTITSARRLDRLLTQPFGGVEAYSGFHAVRVTLADTLAGQVDDVAAADLEYLGTLDGATPQREAA